MIDGATLGSVGTHVHVHRDGAPFRARVGRRLRLDWPVLPVAALAALLHTWALSTVGWGNGYYAAAVRSMTTSWHNFLFGSFDPGGFVTVDKPPLSLWVQVLSVKILGYSELAVLLPQAAAGTAAVVVLYLGVRSVWGRVAGIAAALALALTPINVAVNRSNNTDSVLVLLMTVSAVTALHAARTGRLRWLLLAAAFAGTAMTAKMLAAAPVMPAVLVAYLWCAPRRWTVRLAQTALAGAVLAVTGLWWFAVVDLTPDHERPYVGSSVSNSAFQLAFERNGVNQVEGDQGLGRGAAPGGRAPGPQGRGFAGGEPGAGRLFNADLGTQIAWTIPFGVLGACGALLAVGWRASPRLASIIVFGGWFAAGAAVFSVTKGIVHPYYVASIGPPLAGLVGVGVAAFRAEAVRGEGVRRHAGALVAIVALGLTGAAQWTLLGRAEWRSWRPWVRGGVVATIAAVVLALLAYWARPRDRGRALVPLALVGPVLLAPALWTQAALAAPLNAATGGPVPYTAPRVATAGPSTASPTAPPTLPRGGDSALPVRDVAALLRYLRANRGTARWVVAVESARQAQTFIIEQGEPVMPVGGFSGRDPILTDDRLRTMVAAGEIRYFLLPPAGIGPGGIGPGGIGPGGIGAGGRNPRVPGLGLQLRPGGPATDPTLGGLLPGIPGPMPGPGPRPVVPGVAIAPIVRAECRVVPEAEWRGVAHVPEPLLPGLAAPATSTLYDCQGLAPSS